MCWTYAADAMVSVELVGAVPSQPASRSRHLDAPWSPKTKLLLSGPAGRDTPKAWDDHGSLVMSPFFTSPNHDRYMVFLMATIRWCPIFPKWDSYQPLPKAWDDLAEKFRWNPNPKVDLGSASTSEIDITNCNATLVRSCGENVISLSRDSSKTLTVVSSSLWPNFAKAQMKLDKFWLRNSVRISTARKAMPLMSPVSLKAKLAKAQMLLAHSCGLNSLTWFLAVDEAVYLLYTFNGLV